MRNKPLSTWRDALTAVRCNRRALRQRGLTGEDMAFLEVWLSMPRAPLAALGRIRGYSRQAAAARAKRLQLIGAVIRTAAGLLPNVRGLLRWSAQGVKQRLAVAAERVRRARAAAAERRNALETWHKGQKVNGTLTHRGQETERRAEKGAGLQVRPVARVNQAEEARWLLAMGLLE